MSDQYVGEIRMFAGNFAPYGWALCNGQIMAISQNTALFSLLGTYYGGNGTSNFALPNLQGMMPMAFGNGAGLTPRSVGETGGETAVTLLQTEMPSHTHGAACDLVGGNSVSPVGNVWAEDKKGKSALNYYSDVVSNPGTMAPSILGVAGGSQPHNNLSPYLVVNFIIALQGIYPARS